MTTASKETPRDGHLEANSTNQTATADNDSLGPNAFRRMCIGGVWHERRRTSNGWRLIAEDGSTDDIEPANVPAGATKRAPSAPLTPTSLPRAVARISGSAIFATLPPVEMLCPGLELAAGAPTLLAGLGASGKSWLAQDLALSVASGSDAWGAFPCRKGRALHLDYEQGARLTCERYQRLARARGLSESDIGDRLAIVISPSIYLDSPNAEDWLIREADGCALVIIDSLSAATPGTDENTGQARVALDMLGRVSARTGAAFLVLHHSRKPSNDDASPALSRYAIRGHSSLFDACQAVLVATPPVADRVDSDGSPRPGKPAVLSLEKARLTGRAFGAPLPYVITDREIEGDPRAGVAVEAIQPESELTLEERIVWHVKRNEVVTARELRTRVRCNPRALTDALAAMVERGALLTASVMVAGREREGYKLP